MSAESVVRLGIWSMMASFNSVGRVSSLFGLVMELGELCLRRFAKRWKTCGMCRSLVLDMVILFLYGRKYGGRTLGKEEGNQLGLNLLSVYWC